MMRITIAIVVAASLGLPAAFAQTPADKKTAAKLMLELDQATPKVVPTPGMPNTMGGPTDWDASIEKIGAIVAQASGTHVEPHALYLLGCALFGSGDIDQAKATFVDLKERFSAHPLCTKAKVFQKEKSLVDQALEDCTQEISWRRDHKVKTLPKPQLDPKSTTTIHTSQGDVKIQFYSNVAPKHRENFMKLARKGFYDRTRIHRVMPGKFVHMGDPNSKQNDPTSWGKGSPGYVLDSEFSLVSHTKGSISAWRGPGRAQSHGSQFQILLADHAHYNFTHTPFAQVVEGLDIIDRVSRLTRNQHEAPVEHVFVNGISTPKL